MSHGVYNEVRPPSKKLNIFDIVHTSKIKGAEPGGKVKGLVSHDEFEDEGGQLVSIFIGKIWRKSVHESE